MKNICIHVVVYILTAIVLLYSGWFEWHKGNKIIGAITFTIAVFMLWRAYDNYEIIVVNKNQNIAYI